MKKVLFIGLLFALVAGGCAVTGPYATVKNLREAAKTGNEQQMVENIDFPLLRQNLKAQVGDLAASKTGGSGLFADIARGLASAVGGTLIDAVVTPVGITKAMSGEYTSLINPPPPPSEGRAAAAPTPEKRSERLFKDARYTFDATDQVSIWAKDKNERETRFVLSRYGLNTWKLTNIIFAPESLTITP